MMGLVAVLWFITLFTAVLLGLAAEDKWGLLARFLILGIFPLASMSIGFAVIDWLSITGDTGMVVFLSASSLCNMCVAVLCYRYFWLNAPSE